MNKNAPILMIVIAIVFAVSVCLFFAYNKADSLPLAHFQNVSLENSTSLNIETRQAVKVDPVLKKSVFSKSFEKVDANQKIEKALQNIKSNSRLPTGQLKVEQEYLQSHEAFEGSRWKLLLKVKAVLRGQWTEGQIVVGEMGRFQLVEVVNSDSSLNQYDRNSPAVVYETRLKKTGLVTGLIKVETDRKDLLGSAVRNMNAEITNSFDSIQTYYVTSEQTIFDLENLFFKIKSLGFIKTAELDILDREYEKK